MDEEVFKHSFAWEETWAQQIKDYLQVGDSTKTEQQKQRSYSGNVLGILGSPSLDK